MTIHLSRNSNASSNRMSSGAKIEGYTSAQRGDLTNDEEVRARMELKKQAWRSGQSLPMQS